MNLSGEFGVAAGAVVYANCGKARIYQRLAYGHICHAFHVVGEPGAAVDDHNNLVFLLRCLWQIDVQTVGFEVVPRIVYVPISGICLRHPESLSLRRQRHSETQQRNPYFANHIHC